MVFRGNEYGFSRRLAAVKTNMVFHGALPP
jgi:hypothetical protein